MPTPAERLRQVKSKISRANEHLADLEQETRTFLENEPYRVGTRHDPDSRKLVYYVKDVEPTPDRLALIAGDAIQNLISALDHLAYQLVCCDTAEAPPQPSRIYFPIADDEKGYESKKLSKMEGVHRDTLAAIDALRPYRGGDDLLWTLYRLNNIDKHRLLLTVGSQAAGIHLGQLMAHYSAADLPETVVSDLESMEVFLNPADKGFPLAPDFELYIGGVDEEPNPKQQFRFAVVLSEPGIVEGQPLLETVTRFAERVEDIVATLTPRLG